jgi:hypothetical protein
MRVFGCVVASAFEATTATHPFGNTSKAEFYWWDLLLIVACSTVHGFLPCSTVPAGPVRLNAKNALNRVRSNKIKKIFLIFNCVLFKKLMLNIIQ